MTRTAITAAVNAVVLACAIATRAADLPAFPGAEGPGANATGGRGKPVYHVTNLNSDGPGSFRDAVSKSDRTIVFDVGGTIHLMPPGGRGWIKSAASNLTIAGETAPGDGITIKGQGIKFTGRNVIMRNLKVRTGMDQLKPGVSTNDGITNYLQDSIIDHVSVTWADDEGLSTSDAARNVTVQYGLIGEILNYHNHGFGALIATEHPDTPQSYHHNLFASVKSRLPRLGSEKGSGSILNFSNNVIYNWTGGQAGYSAVDIDGLKKGKAIPQPSRTNFLGNYYIAGPDTGATDPTFNGATKETAVWQDAERPNLVDMNANGRLDGKDRAWNFFTGTFTRAEKAFPVASGFVQPAAEAYEQVLNYGGAFWWKRDAIDARIVNDVRTFRGANIRYAEDVGGWLNTPEVKRPADFDTDNDGMPDAWEISRGLDPKVDDHAGDYNNDGYTNIEKYFHELAAFPAPRTLQYVRSEGGRFEDVERWELAWKPSRYDSVYIGGGRLVTVTSPGQAARNIRVTGGAKFDLVGGSLSATHLNVSPDASFNFTGGRLDVNNVEGNLVVDGGTLSPGVSDAGLLQVDGDLTLRKGALRLDVTNKDTTDRLNIKGTLHLDGEVQVVTAGGYRAPVGTKITLGTAKAVTGSPKVSDGWAVEWAEGKVTQTPFYNVYLVAK